MTMFLSNSMISGSGGGGASFDDSTLKTEDDFYIHALRRDRDGMLHYTKVRSTDDGVTGDFHRNDGTQYPDFLEGIDYVEETTESKSYTNHPADKYQQFRFDFRRISYFVDDDGYFVARVGGTYDYTTEGPK